MICLETPTSPVHIAAGIGAAEVFHARLDDVQDLFGDSNATDFDSVNIFGSDEEVPETPDIQMLTAEGDSDGAAMDMWSEIESQPPSPRNFPRKFTAADFKGLDNTLFGPPAGNDEDE